MWQREGELLTLGGVLCGLQLMKLAPWARLGGLHRLVAELASSSNASSSESGRLVLPAAKSAPRRLVVAGTRSVVTDLLPRVTARRVGWPPRSGERRSVK